MSSTNQVAEPLAIEETLSVNPLRSPVQRGLAIAQQVKDSITILLMLSNGMLFFGVMVGIALPGLVLYAVRWGQVKRYGRPSPGLWVLSLLHELACIGLFLSDHPQHSDTDGHFEGGYLLGAIICLLALADLAWARMNKADEDFEATLTEA